jgi:radical SAM protein with 4Fe4S-binding SPASM domain
MSLAGTPVELALPQFVQIEPVGQCNLRCRMCPVMYREDGWPGKPPALMSFDAFQRILDQFPGINELHLQGLGEPLLHPRFFDMVRHAVARGMEVSTNTNLTALSERRAEECVQSGLSRMYVSIDAAEAAAYEYIRTGATYERVLRNLGRMLEAKQRLTARFPEIHLVAVVMRRNLEQLPALVALAHEYGTRGLSVQHLCHDFSESSLPEKYRPMRAFVDAETLLGEDPARIERFFSEARALAAALGLELRLPRVQPLPHPAGTQGRSRCDWPWRGSYISFSGEAMPCCMVATPDRINFGNMSREGVVRVWNSDAYRRFRDRLASDDPPEICKGCAVYRGTF